MKAWDNSMSIEPLAYKYMLYVNHWNSSYLQINSAILSYQGEYTNH